MGSQTQGPRGGWLSNNPGTEKSGRTISSISYMQFTGGLFHIASGSTLATEVTLKYISYIPKLHERS